jgi:hypothetical protein
MDAYKNQKAGHGPCLFVATKLNQQLFIQPGVGGGRLSSSAKAENRQLYSSTTKAHRFPTGWSPDVDSLSFDKTTGISYEVFATVRTCIKPDSGSEWQYSRVSSN